MAKNKTARSMLCESVGICSLCGLRIPNYIASSDHPLFGTIDHVIPLSRGGKNTADNRKPAHQLCNRMKGNAHPPTGVRIKNMRGNIRALLIRLGEPVTEKHMRQAEKRVQSLYFESRPITIMRWEDDGGSVSIET